MDTFSLTDIKKKNLSDIYHYIYQNPGCSKQAIAYALAVSLPTVSQHLITLLNEKLIEKSGQLTSTVGRRATAYQIIPTAKISIGIEILSRNVYVTALNLSITFVFTFRRRSCSWQQPALIDCCVPAVLI